MEMQVLHLRGAWKLGDTFTKNSILLKMFSIGYSIFVVLQVPVWVLRIDQGLR